MNGTYVGHLAHHDPMRDFLARITYDQLGVRVARPSFRVFQLRGSNEVYAYEEKSSGARVICKFYGPKFGWDHDKAASVARTEGSALDGTSPCG